VRRLVVNADDVGLHPGINTGAVEAHNEGIVTSVSLAATGAAFDHAVCLLAQAPRLGIGVHLTLVGEAALSPAGSLPTLAPAGRLPSHFSSFFARLHAGCIGQGEIERELAAQIERVLNSGLHVTHVDSHQHVHLHPRILPLAARLAAEYGIKGIRAPRRVRPAFGLRPALLALACARAGRLASALRSPSFLVGTRNPGRLDARQLTSQLEGLPPGDSELVCHPGTGDAAIAARYPWGYRWDEERRALSSASVRAAVRAAGVQLVHYGEL
jgi:predicted glycoside hydrolase/deacetylase ChbG (UPF0249 family)